MDGGGLRRWWPAATLAISIIGLTGAAFSLREPHYWDATFYVPFAEAIREHPFHLILDGLPIVNTPGQGVVIAAGWFVTGRNIWMPHLVSLVAAAVVLRATYRFVRRAHPDAFVAFVAIAALVAVPLFQSQARLALPEMLSGACMALAVLALASDRPGAGGAWLAASVIVKLNAAAAVPALAAWAVWRAWQLAPPDRRARLRMTARSLLLVAMPPAATVVAWLLYHYVITDGLTFTHTRGGVFLSAVPGGGLEPSLILNRGWDRLRELAVPLALGPLAIGAFVGAVAPRTDHARATLTAGLLGLLPAIGFVPMLAVTGVPLPRYMAPALGPLVAGLVLLASRRGRVWVAGWSAATVITGLTLMWRRVPSPALQLTDRRVLVVAAILLVVGLATSVRARARAPRRTAVAGIAFSGLLALAYFWSTFGVFDPESTLVYRDLVARDQAIMRLTERAWLRDKAAPVVEIVDPRIPFPYYVYGELPYLGWVTRPVRFADPDRVPCRYLLISRPSVIEGRDVVGILGRISPRGSNWDEFEERVVSRVDCRAAGAP